MAPRDWLLLLIALPPASVGLDPVRLQKGAFLLAMEGGLPGEQRYRFTPYNYGPMSSALYRDVDGLVEAGLVERVPARGYSWDRYRTTPAGHEHALELIDRCRPPKPLRALLRIKGEIVGMSFAELLSDIYEHYPLYAARSVFRR